MKLLVIGHAFLLAYIQKKYVAMKELDPDLQLRLVVPSSMMDRFHRQKSEIHPALAANEVVPFKAWLAGIQAHMSYVHNPAGLAAVLRSFQPDVIHVEEEPQALVTVETISLQRIFARAAGVTLFTWDNLLRSRRFPIGDVKRLLRRYSLARATTVICGNQRAAELLRSEGYFKGTIQTLPHSGLDVSDHQPGTEPQLRAKLGLENCIVVGHVGRLIEEKGLLLLLEALRRVEAHPWKLLLVGSGVLESEIREKWMAEFPGRIVLVPAVAYDQVTQYLRCVDIFVLASCATPTWAEQFGQTLAQAMLLGIPSIGSTSGAIPEVLGSGGLLFEEGQVDGLTQALEGLLVSPATRQELGSRGREVALRDYTSESVGARYLAAFQRARRSPPPGKQRVEENHCDAQGVSPHHS
jgi:glycosyltransferase involved in cell wall biosynthesis